MKNLLNQTRKKIIKLLGGYTCEPHEALTEIVKEHFNTISEEDILKEINNGWIFEGQTIPYEVIKVLSGQADAILRMKVWEVIKKDAKYISNKKVFLKSQTEYDLIAGKLLLYLFDVIESRLKSISSGKGNIDM